MSLSKEKKILFNEIKYKNWFLGKGDDERVRIIVDLVGKDSRVLDIGCCNGEIGQILQKGGNDVYGTDISPTCVSNARQRNIEAALMDIERDPLPFDVCFDVIVMGELIEHLADTGSLLIKVRDYLEDGGYLILSTPNIAALGRRFLLLAGLNPHLEVSYEEHSAGHLRYFTWKLLRDLMEESGFEVEYFTSDVVNFNSKGTFNSIILAKVFPTLGRTLIIKCKKVMIPS